MVYQYTMVYHGVPWYTMWYHGISLIYHGTTVHHGTTMWWHIAVVLRCTMVYHGLLQYTMVHHGTPWYTTLRLWCVMTLSHHDIPWCTPCTMVYHGLPWCTVVYQGVPWCTMVYHCTTTMCYDTVVYHSLYTMLTTHSMFAGDLHSHTAVAGLALHLLLSTDPTAWHTDSRTEMGRHLAVKEQTYRRCRIYWPMYSAVMWRQFSLAGGHKEP